jgi:hypothetical protein
MEPPIQVSIAGMHYTGKAHWVELDNLSAVRMYRLPGSSQPMLRNAVAIDVPKRYE